LKTGTIQVQGHYYKTFVDAHFPVFKAIVDYTDTQPLQGNIDNSEELSTSEDICYTDSDQTNMKTLFVHENTDKYTLCMYNCLHTFCVYNTFI
jgi:hypothetical protein